MSISNVCNTSSDCETAIPDGVVRYCYEEAIFSDEVFFCDCSPWFGWKGEQCNEESFQLYWFRTIFILIAVLSLTGFVFNFKVVIDQFYLAKVRGEKPHIIALTCSCFMFSCACFLVHASIQLAGLFDATRFEIITYNFPEFEDLTVTHGDFSTFLTLLAPVAHLYGNLLIVMTWFKILRSVAKVFPEAFGRRERILGYGLYITVFSYMFCYIIGAALKSLVLIAVLAFETLSLNILYLYSTFAFNEKINKLLEGDTETKQSLTKSIQTSFWITTSSLVVVFVLTFFFTIINPFQYEILRIGGFNYIAALRDIAFVSALAQANYVAWFFNRTTYQQKLTVMSSVVKTETNY